MRLPDKLDSRDQPLHFRIGLEKDGTYPTWYEGEGHGYPVFLHCSRALRSFRSADKTPRKGVGAAAMEIFYWIGGILAFGLVVYLIMALMKPGIFS